jgi:2-polyprenyl-3-methyl-5-hydroxy-6-metoxy-1,4-benzoquinol methylase
MTTRQAPVPDDYRASRDRLLGLMAGAHVSILILLGLRLGLYRALKDTAPASSDELAQHTGLHERWLREWLRGQAAAGVIHYLGDNRFELSPAAALLLADEDDVSFLGPNFYSLPLSIDGAQRLPEAFRTGLGLNWADSGPEAVNAGEQNLRNWYRQQLVPTALPMLDSVVDKLREGGRVADVGCGTGIALIEMARAFPVSEFHGYEISEHALRRAEAHRKEAGLESVVFHNVALEPLPADASFDLVTTFDCLHEMTRPTEGAAAIRGAVGPDGTWFILDINSAPSFEENLTNPAAPMLYAMSVLACLPAGLSEPGGAGLGTLGLPEPAMRELVSAAGFTRFRRLNLRYPPHAFYEARP